jgi:hypothetical protein
MPIPDIIPIKRFEDYHTHYIGHLADGRQFFGYEVIVLPKVITGADWGSHTQQYAVLYLFDRDGTHLQTDFWYGGTSGEPRSPGTHVKLEEMVAALGPYEFGDIRVRPFVTMIDDEEFGLVPDEEYECINLQPSMSIAFYAPWDGEYDT